jgi:predicted MFS family arabinose efflux permease
MYDDEQPYKNENRVLKLAMCVFQLGTEPLSLLHMLSVDVQVSAQNIAVQNTIYSRLETITGRIP